jgi:endonuclease-3
MATPSKSQLLNEIHTLLKKRYKPKPERNQGKLNVLESVIYGICHEGTTREQANQALSRFKDGFFNWNEVRVSTIDEIQSALAGFPEPEVRAQQIRRFLRQLFDKTYGFSLDALTKKPLKESLKALSDYDVFASDYIQATVTQQALGGHAIPIDEPKRRALVRLGLIDADAEPAAIRSLLERAIPKNRGAEFVDLLEDLAHDACVVPEPDCPRCELKKLCPTAQTRKEEAAAAARHAAAQAKAVAKETAKAGAGASRATRVSSDGVKSLKAPKAAKGRSGSSK